MCNGRLTLTVRTPEGARKHKGAYALVSVAPHPVFPLCFPPEPLAPFRLATL